MSFTGKVVAITGGASGMGLATGKILASKGAKISIADFNKETLAAAQKYYADAGTECLTTHVDVSQSKQVDDWIAATIERFGRLDLGVNCAGIGDPTSPKIVDCSDENWHKVQNVNLDGVFFSVRAQLRVMADNGAIVNISSVAGLRGYEGLASYCASKHGVIAVTKTAAREMGHKNIRVNAVCPSLIDTPLIHVPGHAEAVLAIMDTMKAAIPLGRVGQAEEVAQYITWLLSSDASFVNGGAYLVDGGLFA